MTLAERTIAKQKENLRKVHNFRFEHGDTEYRMQYDGGVAEYISVYGRRKGTQGAYRYMFGFYAFGFYTDTEAIKYAKDYVVLS